MDAAKTKLIVITGPFGAGLKDIVAEILNSRTDLTTVTPVTARKMKDGEQNGVSFFFYDLEGWTAMEESGDLLEATVLAGNDYGTSRTLVEDALRGGKHVLLMLEPERAAQVKQNMPEACCLYVEPSDPEELRARYSMTARNSYELTARMELAAEQRAASGYCDIRVDSTDPAEAVREIQTLIDRL